MSYKTTNTYKGWQLVVVPVLYPDIVQVDEITGGERGDAGYGSTGR